MPQSGSISKILRFGTFELDVCARELRRRGVRIKLQDQPFEVLLILLEKPGQIVSREDLRQRIWPADTFVEFDQGVYSALRRLREALADSAENPRFIETVPRRGYRFIAPVEETAAASESAPVMGPANGSSIASSSSGAQGQPFQNFPKRTSSGTLLISLTLAVLAAIVIVAARWLTHTRAPDSGVVTVQRLTDFVGLEDFPAISPDGKTVAFTADRTGSCQIWVCLLAGGTPLQITSGNGDHALPRWTPDSSTLLYYSAPPHGESEGTIWEVSALGGTPRMLARSLSSADISHDGRFLAFFRLNENRVVELVKLDRQTSAARVIAQLPSSQEAYDSPRWSPDDSSIAFIEHLNLYADDIQYIAASGGTVHPITRESVLMAGFSWLPDGTGIIYSSSRESTVIYLPTMHLWMASLDGSPPRQLTYGETSLQNPDVDRHGRIVASRLKMDYGIWKFPLSADARQNVLRGEKLTQETGQVQTPSVAPQDRELAYLSDDGSHGNIWVMNLNSWLSRQITNERDPRVALGLPVWSPDGSSIAFVSTRDTPNWNVLGLWTVHPDGSGLRRLVPEIDGYPTWSNDAQWIYFTKSENGILEIWKAPSQVGIPTLVRTDNAIIAAPSPDGSRLYYLQPQMNGSGVPDYEIQIASPENGISRHLARIDGTRAPRWQIVQPTISHSGQWLALPLTDGATTNLFLISTADGRLHPVTNFGARRTFIVRRVSWSSDDRFLFAAVADGDADIIRMDGIMLGK